MKKILFPLLALVGTMSMNAQVMKIMKGTEVVATYTADQADNVVFEEAPAVTTTGTAQRTGGIDVNWVQLWENGPKFAEYNVGAANNKAEDYGGYYAWGGSQDKVDDHNTTNDGSENLNLTGDDDTATKLWGSNWRMPKKTELEALLNSVNCTCEWTENYNGTGVNGLLCKGKDDTAYASNSVFLPAAGYFYCYYGSVYGQGYGGYYWSSTPDGSYSAYGLNYNSGSQVVNDSRLLGYSVRAVLKETPATTGTAKATIGGSQVDVNWVQLWENGPKFAEKNVGASSATDVGSTMTFTDATKAGADYVWGANWCTPSKDQMDELRKAASVGSEEVKCELVKDGNGNIIGFKFTGKKTGYTGNSVFFPAQYGDSYDGNADYWSATAGDSGAWGVYLSYSLGSWYSNWSSRGQDYGYLVRPVFKN